MAEARTLPVMLLAQGERHGERPFLSIAGGRWSHAATARIAARAGAALGDAGIGRGDRVAVMCGNRAETLEVVLGCGWTGAVAVPINTAAMGPQIGHVLADSGARLLVVEPAYLDRLAAAELGRTALRAVWVVAAEPGHRDARRDGVADDVADADADVASPAASRVPANAGAPSIPHRPYPRLSRTVPPADVRPADPLAILYTSGTTGPAKGVVCPHSQFHAWGENTACILGVTADDVLCTTLPLFHINALNTFAQAALRGARVVFEPRFSASGFWPAMRAAEATVVYLLGAMAPILLARPEGEAERAHRVRIGLGPGVPPAAARAFAARTGVALVDGYGSTETNFVIATRPGAAAPADGRMGWLRPGFSARVVDAGDLDVADGEAGELLLRAEQPGDFSAGYFNRPDDSARAWRGGWFHTGDRVVRDGDGAYRFVDRLKDSIRRRGENVSSHEVEQALLEHPAVAACAVFPVPSELGEDEVMATLVARAGMAIDPAAIARHCAARLPRFAVPRYVDVAADLPRTANGKVQKFVLRERGVGAATWDREAGGGRAAAGRNASLALANPASPG